MVTSLLKDWQERIIDIDETSTLKIIPLCSASLLPFVVDIFDLLSSRGKKSNAKKSKKMIILLLKYKL